MYLLASITIDIVLCTAYFVFVFILTFPHPGLYWIYGNKDDDDESHRAHWRAGFFGTRASEVVVAWR
jgi:hypothetical protein